MEHFHCGPATPYIYPERFPNSAPCGQTEKC
jgi:hypothetical protein